MPPSSSPPGGLRRFLKRCGRGVKKLFRPGARAPAPRTPSPQPRPPSAPGVSLSRLSPTHEILLQPLAQSQQPAHLPQPVPGVGGSTSATNLVAADDVQPANAESRMAQVAKQAGVDAWTGLKATLRLVEKSSDVFPPLKSAVAGFLGVVDIFETAAQNRKDYAGLALNIQGLLDEFRQHPEEHTSFKMSEALKAMANNLEEEMRHVMEQRQRSGFRSHLEAGQDVGDVQECHRRVEVLCRALQNKAVLETWSVAGEQQANARLKQLDAALKATYNSKLSAVVGRRACTPGTREAILAEMQKWADDSESPKVYWLNGMAGTGKTTLAYSFCAEMRQTSRLGASFFCSRGDPDSQDASRIVPTIAHQLARLLPSYCEVLIQQIGEDKDIGEWDIPTQFEKLIRAPLCKAKVPVPEGIVVTIDALDECSRRDGAQNILDVLFLHARDLPIKFLVTSRPEPGLFDTVQSKDEHYRSVFHLHDVEASFVQADIRTYLQAELGAISLSPEKLELLAEQAGTLFIYAATAVRYIRPGGRRANFHRLLDDLLAVASKSEADKHRDIDRLYIAVLTAPFADEDIRVREKEHIRLVLDTAICAREPMSVAAMAKLLELEEEDVICALQHLRSVLHVSQGDDLISTLHASFPDFLLDRDRSKDLWCNSAKHHHHLSLHCFSTMSRALRFNICELETSFDLDEHIPNLAKKIESAISPELFYACRYWADHLVPVEALDDVLSALEEFLSHRLLFWMEVLNLNRCINIGARGLFRVQAWTQVKTSCPIDLRQLARDAAGFVTMFSSNTVSHSTPHIYISALPFWPEQRPVSKHYLPKMQGLPKASGTAMSRRDSAPLAICTTPSRVFAVAYSSDGARIVSGSYDNTIRVWDAHTGTMIGAPLTGHTGLVMSVAYSTDGARIVSGSYDKTIRVWDAHTGMMIGAPLEGHTSAVMLVAYSTDGARIVSGSCDKTIRVWDVHTGAMIGAPLEGHTSYVISVAYSTDNARIISGSKDKTIRVWDVHTGAMIGAPLEGHTGAVRSVVYSTDGARIVSGSEDKTIRVRDAHTGTMIGAPLEGHTGYVMSVAYSNDGARIVSGSWDKTIRVWDAHTGTMIGAPLKGHTGFVMSVAYSSDGARIVSGSWDKTIRVWDAHTGTMIGAPLEGHTSYVMSVAYSTDGARIVFGSWDNTIRVWDVHTGTMIGAPLEGHTGAVRSVAYSTDGARIVSGSEDKTIRIWDTHTGTMIGAPLKGHTGLVMSVAYSNDGACIVSGSYDNTIRVWDAHTGAMIGTPLKGHTNYVMSVAYSTDGARIVSGSYDKTIRVWDAHTGTMIGAPLKGHTSHVMSVAYSTDGARIVSGSEDKTIRVWDVHTGTMIGAPLTGHTGLVTSVAYSSDGARIVSGSYDNTIRVWDAHTGTMIGAPLTGHTGLVTSVAYSSDSARIVSGSSDNTIRITDCGHMSSDPCNTWVLDKDGYMIANGSKLLMWVPSEVRDTLLRPQNTAVISTQGSVKADFANTRIGDSWAQCYRFM